MGRHRRNPSVTVALARRSCATPGLCRAFRSGGGGSGGVSVKLEDQTSTVCGTCAHASYTRSYYSLIHDSPFGQTGLSTSRSITRVLPPPLRQPNCSCRACPRAASSFCGPCTATYSTSTSRSRVSTSSRPRASSRPCRATSAHGMAPARAS